MREYVVVDKLWSRRKSTNCKGCTMERGGKKKNLEIVRRKWFDYDLRVGFVIPNYRSLCNGVPTLAVTLLPTGLIECN